MNSCSFVLKFMSQNAENRILGLWNFKIFLARTCPDPLPPPEKGDQQLLVDTVGYSIQICWLLQLLLKPLPVYESKVFSCEGKSQELDRITIFFMLLRARRGALNPNLQVIITHASHLCSQHSFGLPLRM